MSTPVRIYQGSADPAGARSRAAPRRTDSSTHPLLSSEVKGTSSRSLGGEKRSFNGWLHPERAARPGSVLIPLALGEDGIPIRGDRLPIGRAASRFAGSERHLGRETTTLRATIAPFRSRAAVRETKRSEGGIPSWRVPMAIQLLRGVSSSSCVAYGLRPERWCGAGDVGSDAGSSGWHPPSSSLVSCKGSYWWLRTFRPVGPRRQSEEEQLFVPGSHPTCWMPGRFNRHCYRQPANGQIAAKFDSKNQLQSVNDRMARSSPRLKAAEADHASLVKHEGALLSDAGR